MKRRSNYVAGTVVKLFTGQTGIILGDSPSSSNGTYYMIKIPYTGETKKVFYTDFKPLIKNS